jgi:hypothetical protein
MAKILPQLEANNVRVVGIGNIFATIISNCHSNSARNYVMFLITKSSILIMTNFGYMVQTKVETPIHDSIRELITWEFKEHGVNIMNVLANPKGTVGRWYLNFWRLEQFYTSF